MAVVWLILKVILWILLGLLGLFLVVLILPVTAELAYGKKNGFTAALRVLGIRFRLFPKKEKPKKKENVKKAKPKAEKTTEKPLKSQQCPPPKEGDGQEKQPALAEKTEPCPAGSHQELPKTQQPAPAPEPSSRGVKEKAQREAKKESPVKAFLKILEKAKQLLLIAGKGVRMLLRGVWIHGIRVYLPVHEADAAQTAIKTGQIHGAAGAALGVMNNFLNLSFKQYEIEPDYTGQRQNDAFFSCKVTSCLLIMVIVALWALPKVLKTLKTKEI